MPRPAVHLNLSVPDLAEEAARLPAAGVGLMRAEFLALAVGRHPLALLEEGGEQAFRDIFRHGLERVARAFHPRPVTYRTLDLKTNEYRGLDGGERFEPIEANPAIGRRGAFRYLRGPEELRLELSAVKAVIDSGLDNVRVMLPFVRTLDELRGVKEIVADSGLPERPGFELWLMAEVPSTVLLAERFAAEVAGVSIGSNDLAQLVLGVDRDSAELGERYPPTDEGVLAAIACMIEGAHAAGVPVSICGDAPSRQPGLVRTLVDLGIDAISVVPSAFEETLAAVEGATARKSTGHPSPDRAVVAERIARYGANVRAFFHAGQRSTLISPLFNVPARLVLGGYCYFEHAAAVLREVARHAAPEEIGRRMKGVCVRPNYVGLNAIMLGYLNGREQLRLRAGLAEGEALPAESLADHAFVLDFCERVARAYVEGGAWLPLDTGHTLRILPPEDAAQLAELARPPDNPDVRVATRRALAITELYTFILNGEARVGVFNHGPYDLGGGEQLLVKELVGLRDDYLPWRITARPPVDNVARIMRVSGLDVSIDLFGSLVTRPFEYEDFVVADCTVTVEDGALRPLGSAELQAVGTASADAQVEMYSQAAAWTDDYRVAYGADLYGSLLSAFPRVAGLDLDAEIRARFAGCVERYAPGLRSGDDPPLVLARLGATAGEAYSTALPA